MCLMLFSKKLVTAFFFITIMHIGLWGIVTQLEGFLLLLLLWGAPAQTMTQCAKMYINTNLRGLCSAWPVAAFLCTWCLEIRSKHLIVASWWALLRGPVSSTISKCSYFNLFHKHEKPWATSMELHKQTSEGGNIVPLLSGFNENLGLFAFNNCAYMTKN